jgi:hypothetical protein
MGDVTMFYDANTHETITYNNPCELHEDFVGPGHTTIPTAGSPSAGYPWVQKIVGSGPPTVGPVSNYAGGLVRAALTSTSEKEDAALYANDALNWDVTKGLIFEARVAMHVVPSAAAVEMVFGLQSAWIDGPDNASYYVQFQALASGLINMRTKDGVNTISKATSVTLVADAFHIFRIDCSDVTDIKFFIDGVQQSANNALSFAATGASAILQPYCSVYKASGTGVGSLDIDALAMAMNRS